MDGFRARLRALKVPDRFGIAVSGGRDSMCLARACADYARDTGAYVHAFTVDHGLRSESAKEAAQVKTWCAEVGLKHETLRWTGEKPKTGVQAAARLARYTLLARAAADNDLGAILTAHTGDDQAETVFMRLARGAGVRGLSAMHDQSLIAAGPSQPVRLLRPLLLFRRAAVTRALGAFNQAYIDDPSNEDPKFERVRVRALLGALEEQDLLTVAALRATADKMRTAREIQRGFEEALFDDLAGCFHGWGGVSLTDPADGSASGEAGLVQRIVYAVGGGAYPPEEAASVEALRQARATGTATLGGVMVQRWRRRIWFFREPGALLGRAGVPPMELTPLMGEMVWDGRFIIRGGCGGRGDASLDVGPLGPDAARILGGAKTSLFEGPSEALSTLPGVFQDGVLIGALASPFMSSTAVQTTVLTSERFAGEIIRFS